MAAPMTEADMDAVAGEALSMFEADFGAIPPEIWQMILAAIQALMGGCIKPTPASVRAQFQRPLFCARLMNQLHFRSVPKPASVVSSLRVVVTAAPDEKVEKFIMAVQAA